MNLVKINELRASMGLDPMVRNEAKAAKAKRNARNRIARGEASRAIKASRNSRSK